MTMLYVTLLSLALIQELGHGMYCYKKRSQVWQITEHTMLKCMGLC